MVKFILDILKLIVKKHVQSLKINRIYAGEVWAIESLCD